MGSQNTSNRLLEDRPDTPRAGGREGGKVGVAEGVAGSTNRWRDGSTGVGSGVGGGVGVGGGWGGGFADHMRMISRVEMLRGAASEVKYFIPKP
jgi:hypothetical protein